MTLNGDRVARLFILDLGFARVVDFAYCCLTVGGIRVLLLVLILYSQFTTQHRGDKKERNNFYNFYHFASF